MRKTVAIFCLAFFASPMSGHAQAPSIATSNAAESQAYSLGGELYNANCATCHQPSGAGAPPDFPALAGNANLADIRHVASTIRAGRGKMLAFPQFGEAEVAALATYVRNSWGNSHGPVTPDQIAPALASLSDPSGPKVSVWTGVYTEQQNQRGAELHSAACAQCHGLRLNGAAQPDQPPSPAIARAAFLRKWSGQSVAALFGYIRYKMPPDAPNTMTDQQTADAIAHILAMSSIPPGASELPADAKRLENIVIEEKAR